MTKLGIFEVDGRRQINATLARAQTTICKCVGGLERLLRFSRNSSPTLTMYVWGSPHPLSIEAVKSVVECGIALQIFPTKETTQYETIYYKCYI